MPKKGKKSKKKVAPKQGEEEGENVPKTFIFHQGKVINAVKNLISDLKNAFAPWTAKNLKPTSKNVLKDYLSLAGPYGISHFLIFSQTTLSTNLRIAKTLYGPTMFFRVHKYSLRSDMVKIQRRALSIQPQDLETPPLVVLNNFSGNEYNVSLMKLMFQNMFPPINVKEVVLRDYRRVVLFHYDKDIDRVYFRHFLITLNPLGMSKSIKRLAQYKVPNLSKLEDIADYVKIGAKATDSDLEDESEAKLDIEEEYNGVLNKTEMQRRSAVRLYEIGPRMELELIKIEQGFCSGEVQYHRYVEKTEEEKEELKKEIERRKQIKAERKKRQEENVLKKQKGEEVDEKEDVDDEEFDEEDDEDSDLQWYRKEVGEEPPEDLKKSVAASNIEDKEKKEKFHPFSYKKKKKGEEDNQKVDKSPKGKKSQRDNNKNNKKTNDRSNRKDSRNKSTPFQSNKRKSLDGKNSRGGGDKKKKFKK